MNLIFLLSVMLKGVGAVLEILLQILITREFGVSGYGMYATWINAADLVFWIFFSGIAKCNTFYLSDKNKSIRAFKKKYYGLYVTPIMIALAAGGAFISGSILPSIVMVIACLELFVIDHSSALIARGKAVKSLIGEYVLGRSILVIMILLLKFSNSLEVQVLLILYIIQYVIVLLFFLFFHREAKEKEYLLQDVSIRKLGAYQRADLMHSMIEQMPVVLQYFFASAFEAGVVSIVLLVKKLINFISGPTAKVFLPEFSKLYHSGEKGKIRSCYASIMRIQMLIVGPLAVVLIGYPKVVLKILAQELVEYAPLFMICSGVFLLAATLGPCGGILQMTGNEKKDNRCREIALIGMLAVMLITRNNSQFVLYGLCAEIIMEITAKYIVICKWMEKAPVTIGGYLKWWLVPCGVIGVTYLCKLQASFLWMVIAAGIVFVIGGIQELRNEENDYLRKKQSFIRKNVK